MKRGVFTVAAWFPEPPKLNATRAADTHECCVDRPIMKLQLPSSTNITTSCHPSTCSRISPHSGANSANGIAKT